MPFSDYIPKLSPTWLRRTTWAKYLSAFAAELDKVTAATKAAVKMRFFTAATTPTDALNQSGGERQLPRGSPNTYGVGVGETDAQYMARVAGARDAWALAGTALGLLRALWYAGYHQARVNIRNGLSYSLDGSLELVQTQLAPGAWLTGSQLGFWSAFDVVLVTPPTPSTGSPSDWTSATPAPTSDEVLAIKALVLQWKPGFALARRLLVLRGGHHYGWPPPPTGPKYGDPGLTWGGGTTDVIPLNF